MSEALRLFLVSVVTSMLASFAIAQDDPVRTESVRFAPGTTGTTINGQVTGRESVIYVLGAEAGQTFSVTMRSDSASVYFNIYAPGQRPGDQALVIGELQDPLNSYTGTLTNSGEYSVVVFLYRNAAREGRTAAYELEIGVSALESTDTPVTGDFADGLQGGPDYWRVELSHADSVLNLRDAPSAAAKLIGTIPPGTRLRNLGGCRMNEARRWCEVETLDDGQSGWVAGDYLIEG